MMRTKGCRFVAVAGLMGAVFVCTPLGVQGQEAQNTNTVTVLLEGYVKPIEGRQPMPGVTDDGARHVAGTVALVRGEGVTLVADPGMVAEQALILDALKKEGVSAEDVTHVFISHHHPDHTVNIALFPNARLVDFWATYTGDLWEDHGDEYAIAPGIRVIQTPGHTEEDASLVVETAQGTYVPDPYLGIPGHHARRRPTDLEPRGAQCESRKGFTARGLDYPRSRQDGTQS